jgi:hypothetical protein
MRRVRLAAWYVGSVAGAVLVASMFWLFVLDATYIGYPRQSVTEQGRTVPYHVKGVTVYLTMGEAENLRLADRAAIASFCIIVACGVVLRGNLTSKPK